MHGLCQKAAEVDSRSVRDLATGDGSEQREPFDVPIEPTFVLWKVPWLYRTDEHPRKARIEVRKNCGNQI